MEFRFDTFLIGMIIFSFIIAVGSGFITSMANEYEVTYDSRFGATHDSIYNTVEGIENMTTSQKESVIGGELPETDLLDSSIKGATSALNLMTAPIKTVTLVIDEIQTNIPGSEDETNPTVMLKPYVKVSLTILIIFGLIYLAFRIRSW